MSEQNPAKEFAILVRTVFEFLEADDGRNPDFNVMDAFYERIFTRSYPWGTNCGYWNVFVNFDIAWDPHDDLFAIWLQSSLGMRPNLSNEPPVLQVDWILDVLNPDWRAGWPDVDKNDGMQLVKLYATAIKPYAREIFIPTVRPSEGLEGFSWWPKVKPRVHPKKGSETEVSPRFSCRHPQLIHQGRIRIT